MWNSSDFSEKTHCVKTYVTRDTELPIGNEFRSMTAEGTEIVLFSCFLCPLYKSQEQSTWLTSTFPWVLVSHHFSYTAILQSTQYHLPLWGNWDSERTSKSSEITVLVSDGLYWKQHCMLQIVLFICSAWNYWHSRYGGLSKTLNSFL